MLEHVAIDLMGCLGKWTWIGHVCAEGLNHYNGYKEIIIKIIR